LSAPLRVGTRGSPLARTQSGQAAAILEASGEAIQMVVVRTSGDRLSEVSLAKVGGKGLFIKELEEALLADEIDLAIHSMKDVPATLPEGFILGAVGARVDERDVLVRSSEFQGGADGLSGLPPRARVGTGSLRRRAQLAALRPDLEVVAIRGNVDTRLGLLDSGDLDAVMLAAAGIQRLGLSVPVHPLASETFLPAAGQGILAIEIRAGDEATRRRIAPLHDVAAATAAAAERAFVHTLDASCTAPVAAWCRLEENQLRCDGLVASLDGQQILRATLTSEPAGAAALGKEVATRLLEQGAAEILAEVERAIWAG
jgi:hydroxymethylbilane synthase